MFSRRDMVRLSSSLLAWSLTRRLTAEPAAPGLKVTLAYEFPKSTLRAISPDGTRLCVEDWTQRGYPLRVVEFDTWATVYTGHIDGRSLGTAFFGDGQTLWIEGPGAHWTLQHVVVDVRTGQRTERMPPFDPNRPANYAPLRGGILLVSRREANPYRTETLSLVEFPSYREIANAPYASQQRKPSVNGSLRQAEHGFGVSADRELLAYSFDDVLVCRRLEDLGVVWARQLDPQLKAHRVVLSAHGDHVAAALADDAFWYQQRAVSVAVYDAKTGAEVARLPLSGTEGVAVSPNGKLLAVVAREPGKKNEEVTTVHIHDVSSGMRLASVVHALVKTRNPFLEGGCSVTFMPDGQHMISVARATKVWKIGD